jgi:hypothetical protein
VRKAKAADGLKACSGGFMLQSISYFVNEVRCFSYLAISKGPPNQKRESKLAVPAFLLRQEAALCVQNRFGFQLFNELAIEKNFS